jgi:hypothetical protein
VFEHGCTCVSSVVCSCCVHVVYVKQNAGDGAGDRDPTKHIPAVEGHTSELVGHDRVTYTSYMVPGSPKGHKHLLTCSTAQSHAVPALIGLGTHRYIITRLKEGSTKLLNVVAVDSSSAR